MKKTVLSCLLLGCLISQSAIPVAAAASTNYFEVKDGVYVVNDKQKTKTSKTLEDTLPKDTFTKKSASDRKARPKEEQIIVDSIEDYVNKKANLKNRALAGDLIDNAIVDLAFNFAFKRDNPLFNQISNILSSNGVADTTYIDWFNALTNKSKRTLTVLDAPTQKNILLQANYIDNGSNKTIILHNGYRAPMTGMLDMVKFYSDEGYNVLLPDTRSHNSSEGQYITFGYYEKDDLNKWINQEAELNPSRDIILAGVSMGAATTMLSQTIPNPNVKAYIEDCGYDSLAQQLRDTLHLLTRYFEYIPVLNWTDWYQKEGQLIDKLNEQKVKPILKFNLYDVSPFDSVSKTGIPKLFIHGEADSFIPPIAQNKLYGNAIGYKERLSVPGAAHALSFVTDYTRYTETVRSFIKTVYNLNTKMPVVAPDVNLLQNPTFTFNATNFTNWETSTNFDNSGFLTNPLERNSYSEFILKKSGTKQVVTAAQYNNGIRFYTADSYNDGLVGQNVPLISGQTYELSFNAKNEINAAFTYPNVLYGIDTVKKEDILKGDQTTSKSLQYTASENKAVKVKIGAKLGHNPFYDLTHHSHTTLNEVKLVNTDRTPPTGVNITNITKKGNTINISGRGEANTKIVIENQEGKLLLEKNTNNKGEFSLDLTKAQASLYHIFNVDIKGNKSESRVVVFQ